MFESSRKGTRVRWEQPHFVTYCPRGTKRSQQHQHWCRQERKVHNDFDKHWVPLPQDVDLRLQCNCLKWNWYPQNQQDVWVESVVQHTVLLRDMHCLLDWHVSFLQLGVRDNISFLLLFKRSKISSSYEKKFKRYIYHILPQTQTHTHTNMFKEFSCWIWT